METLVIIVKVKFSTPKLEHPPHLCNQTIDLWTFQCFTVLLAPHHIEQQYRTQDQTEPVNMSSEKGICFNLTLY